MSCFILFNLILTIMAKAYINQNKRVGSVGGDTYYILRGENIVKSKPVHVTNRRTEPQMIQRARFLDAVGFYKRAVKNFFQFAFENRRRNESDYNAFMRLNANRGGVYVKKWQDNIGTAYVGNWIMSEGSLPAPEYMPTSGYMFSLVVNRGGEAATAITNMGQASKGLIDTYGLMEGDIVTMVAITSDMEATIGTAEDVTALNYKTNPAREPRWRIVQFIIDSSSTVLPADLSLVAEQQGSASKTNTLSVDIDDNEAIGAVVAIFSRKNESRLLTSTSELQLNTQATNFLASIRSQDMQNAILATWNTENVILEGSIARGQAKQKGRMVEPIMPKEQATELSDPNSDDLESAKIRRIKKK